MNKHIRSALDTQTVFDTAAVPDAVLREPTSLGNVVISPKKRPAVDLEVLMPVLNEEKRLPNSLPHLLDYLANKPWSSAVVIIDNGSVDRTVEVAQSYSTHTVPVHIVGCSLRGKGAAVYRGISTGSSRFVGFMDADLATPIDTLDTVMPMLQEGTKAVIGSRYLKDSTVLTKPSIVRRIGSRGYKLFVGSLVTNLKDTQCGFKFFDAELVRNVIADCEITGFTFDVELLAAIQHHGYQVEEIPVAWNSRDGSTFRIIEDGLVAARDLLALHRKFRSSKTTLQ